MPGPSPGPRIPEALLQALVRPAPPTTAREDTRRHKCRCSTKAAKPPDAERDRVAEGHAADRPPQPPGAKAVSTVVQA